MKEFLLALFILLGMSCATIIPPEVKAIRAHAQYEKLREKEKDLVEEIMGKALNSKLRDYYFSKLSLLLDTPTNHPKVTEEKQVEEINRSVEESKRERREIAREARKDLEEYLTQEEFYETMIPDRKWQGYRPEWGEPYFYIADSDPLDILVHIRVRLNGPLHVIEKILLLEDAIEKHLYVEGFSVN